MVPKDNLWHFIERATIDADGDQSPVVHPFEPDWRLSTLRSLSGIIGAREASVLARLLMIYRNGT
jgi:hypothetical protein